jgi:hypothetical protein
MQSTWMRAIIIGCALPGVWGCDRSGTGEKRVVPAKAAVAGTAVEPEVSVAAEEPGVVGGLRFPEPRVVRMAGHGDTEVAVSFPFEVVGERAVKVTDIRTYCSCLSVGTKDGKKEYRPGERGSIEAVFELGAFEGEVEKSLGVTTDLGGEAETELKVAVTIPVLYEAEPANVAWVVGDEPVGKTIRLRMRGEQPIRVVNAVSSRDGMLVEAKEIEPGREYLLTLTPRTTAEPMLGMLRVETDAPWERYRKKLLFFNVAKPSAASAGGGQE